MKIFVVTIFLATSLVVNARPQDPSDGKYYPDLFKQYLGYWTPDDRGQYRPDGRGAGTPGGGFGSAGASRFGSSASRFGNGASSRFGNGGGVASFQNRLSSSSGASRGSFGNVGSSSSSSAVRGAQNTFASNNGVTSQFASNSFQNSENARIAAIGISSSFLPPLAEDSEEFGGFDAPVSTFGGNDNSLRNNFVSTSVSQNGFGGSQASNAFTNQGGSNANRFTGSVSSSNQRVGIRPTTSTTSVISAGNAFGVSSAPSFVQSPVQSSNSDFGSSRLSSSSSSQSSNNGFVKGLGNGATSDGDYKVLRHESEANEDGYHYVYETENQIQAEETGRLLNKGTDDAHIEATGFFEYVGPDGVTYRVDYTADENGFQATGDHLPTPPPIPEAIQKALDAQGLTFP